MYTFFGLGWFVAGICLLTSILLDNKKNLYCANDEWSDGGVKPEHTHIDGSQIRRIKYSPDPSDCSPARSNWSAGAVVRSGGWRDRNAGMTEKHWRPDFISRSGGKATHILTTHRLIIVVMIACFILHQTSLMGCRRYPLPLLGHLHPPTESVFITIAAKIEEWRRRSLFP